MIDRELYPGRNWAGTGEEHEARCREAGVPGERARQVVTKPELARRMAGRTLDAGVAFTWFLAGELCGTSRSLRTWLEEQQVRYVMAVPENEVLPLAGGRTQEARLRWARVPGAVMERRACADGAKGPREYDFATVALAPTPAGLERTLLVRRSTVANKKNEQGELVPEVAYFLCHHAPGTTLAGLVTAAGQRWMVEETFQAAKNEVGLDQHEVRKWCSWYRQTTMSMLALAFPADVRSRRIQPRPPAP
ncbi:transposase [Streptomyces sp. NPDC096030]|uniref:IS701 family transposase n=1 Tax=Streptomyces sp. NPDC096030 TaxID=3155423 RepID=UPI0033241852